MKVVFLAVAKYVFPLFLAFYVLNGFLALHLHGAKNHRGIAFAEKFFLYLTHFVGNLVIYLNTESEDVLIFYGCQLVLFLLVMELFPVIYPAARTDLLNHICMLLVICFLILTRLSVEKSVKQFAILAAAVVLFFILPAIYRKLKHPEKLSWLCFAVGVAALGAVLVVTQVYQGAKLSLTIGPVTVQPSEFVKLTYVFMIAGFLKKGADIKKLLLSGILAATHVGILVLSTDLGAALILAVAWLMMVFAASGKKIYLAAGTAVGAAAAVAAWRLFSHIQTRVSAWLDPFADISDTGYQMAQSLFAIGSGGWFGTGLYEGLPTSIPLVYQDFTFSAIAEEFGGIFAVCLILLYFLIFAVILQSAMDQRDSFRRYLCLGLGVVFETQTFLTIGGAIKLIPSTGVTLPCISYGGSSIMSTMLLFSLVEAACIRNEEEILTRKKREEEAREQRDNGQKAETGQKEGKQSDEGKKGGIDIRERGENGKKRRRKDRSKEKSEE
ncbi:MAG: FtsW/RodA/SpoVE family cell cycle protein [Lachnospiraceae bacterium]|nr:FtsW/RodA/SpoVE family cell cycle protein [Lachnospiraceae bacterium]